MTPPMVTSLCPHAAVCPVCRAAADATRAALAATSPEPDPLTDQHREVVVLLAAGHTYRTAARVLCLSADGVKSRVAAALRATRTRNATELVAVAVRHGWIT